MVIFHYAALPVNNTFAAGLVAPPAVHAPLVPGKKAPFSAIDQAWKLGFDAAMASDFEDVLPREDMTVEEIRAFNLGAAEGYKALEFEDPSDPADWDADDLAAQRDWEFSYQHGGYNHS